MNKDSTLTEEEILLVAHRHWGSMISTGILIAVLIGLFVILRLLPGVGPIPHAIFALMFPLGLLISWILLALTWTTNYLNTIILTDQRVIFAEQISLANHVIHEWNIHNVRNVRVSAANFLETFFNFGSIVVEADGESSLIEGMSDPGYIAAVILRQDDRFQRLKETSQKQRELLKFVSHEVKGHLAKSKAAFAAIIEGDYGKVTSSLGTMAEAALADSQKGVDTVMSILDDSNLTEGEMKFNMQSFDLVITVRSAADDFRSSAESKGLSITVKTDESCMIEGDEQKIARHVIRNLIDNAMHYTQKGIIAIELTKIDGVARLSVADTGIGIAPEEMYALFTSGGHGEHSKDINPESTGYGLYIAKRVVDGHHGRIWAESKGSGTGSRFIVELPIAII